MNLKYFRFADAIKLPVLVSNRVWLAQVAGKVEIVGPIRFGLIRIGFGDVGIFDKHKSRSVWNVTGMVVFRGPARLGHGSKISASGNLVFGENFNITAESQIACHKKITFGDNCLLSWDVLIMDTDFHKIRDNAGKITNEDKEIIIGNNVWIGCRATILKGTVIGDNVVIAANSCVHSAVEGNNRIIGGNPVRVLKKDITWEL